LQTGVRFAQKLKPWCLPRSVAASRVCVVPGRVVNKTVNDHRPGAIRDPRDGASWWCESIAATMSALVTKDVV
jgi:hypothetical protein